LLLWFDSQALGARDSVWMVFVSCRRVKNEREQGDIFVIRDDWEDYKTQRSHNLLCDLTK
jgi:hypothetical protein